MDLKDILAISGQPGLYKFIAQSSRGVIVEALADGKRQNIPPTARVSSMAEIAIFTDTEDLPLEKIFQQIFRELDGGEAISHKSSSADITAFFEKMIPDYDRDRVHVSDMKKVISWYNILNGKGLVDLEEPAEEEEANDENGEEKKAPEKKMPVKEVKPKAASASAPKPAAAKAAAPKMTRGKKG